MKLKIIMSGILILSTLVTTISFAKEKSLEFIENKNQWDCQVKYKAALPGGNVFLTNSGFVYSFYSLEDLHRIHELSHTKSTLELKDEQVHQHAYRVNFVGANPNNTFTAEDKKSYYHNYILGNDRSKWAAHVGLFGGLVQHNIYDGIDVKLYSSGVSMKYDFIVAPGANPSSIALEFKGVQPQITSKGTLKIETSVNALEEGVPYAYQIIDGKEIAVPCRYKQSVAGIITFELPEGYNKSVPLIIDPTLAFGTYSGGTGSTYGFSATYDLGGHLYAGGECFDGGWPTTAGAFQTSFEGGVDAGINKYSSDGSLLIYSTYYGGNGSDLPNNLIVNELNELIMTGSTSSSDLPISATAYDDDLDGGMDIYVAHFTADGSALIGATFIGGSNTDGSNLWSLSPNYGDNNRGEVFTNSSGSIFVASSTMSTNFPTTATAIQSSNAGGQDGVIFELNGDCSSLLYSTYLGGDGDDACFALGINSDGNIVTCGGTTSNDFPTTAGSLKSSFQGITDGFASIINASSSIGLIASTYLGTGEFDHAYKLQIDADDNILVMGQTDGDYPISSDVYNTADGDIFIDKISANLSSSLLSTRLGNQQDGGGRFVPTAFLYDNCRNTYLCGFMGRPDLPVTADAFQDEGMSHFWFGVLEPDFEALKYGTYFGDMGDHVDGGTSRFDPQGIVYHSVCTASPTFPTIGSAWSPDKAAPGYDVASFKFNFEATFLTSAFALAEGYNDSGCVSYSVNFQNNTIDATSYFWDFGDGGTSTEFEPTHTFTEEGTYTVMLAVNNPESCITDDTAYLTIYVLDPEIPQIVVNDTAICNLETIIPLHVTIPNLTPEMTILWGPAGAIVSDPTLSTVNVDPSVSQLISVTVTNNIGGICATENMATIFIDVIKLSPEILNSDTSVCYGAVIEMHAISEIGMYEWSPDNGSIWDREELSTFARITAPATYYFEVTDSLGCYGIDSFEVDIYNPNFSSVTPADTGICPGNEVQYTITGGHYYVWEPGIYLSDSLSATPLATPQTTTKYIVYATDVHGCVDTHNVHLNVHSNATISLPDSVNIYPGESYQISPEGNCLYYQWFPPSGLSAANISNPIASPEVRTRYFVTATTENGCTIVDSIDILVQGTLLDMPNAFVPGNGSNNIFKPVKRGIVALNSFQIFNRWGNKVYDSQNINEGWDGTFNGKPQPAGVYIYTIDAVTESGKPFIKQGNVTLIR